MMTKTTMVKTAVMTKTMMMKAMMMKATMPKAMMMKAMMPKKKLLPYEQTHNRNQPPINIIYDMKNLKLKYYLLINCVFSIFAFC